MKKWFRRIAAAAVAAAVFGMVCPHQQVLAASGIEVSVPENKVLTYQQGETKTFTLEVKNNSAGEIRNLKLTPRMQDSQGEWPFDTEYQSYTLTKESLAAQDVWKAEFDFTARQDVAAGRYVIAFDLEALGDSQQSIGGASAFYVNIRKKDEAEQETVQQKPTEQEIQTGVQPADPFGNEGWMTASAGGFENGSVSAGSGTASGTVPRVIVTGFDTDPGEVKAGSDFKLTIHLKNTSKSVRVQNMLFELASPTEGKDEQTTAPAFLPSSGSNSIYLDGIKADGTADISIQLNAKADLVQKPYSINLAMKYEDPNATQIDAQASVSIPVKQEARFEFSDFEITPAVISVGEEANVSCSLYNLGRLKLYNVKAVFEGEGIKKEELFIGNVESGASATIDAMLEGQKETNGSGKVKMTLSYEDDAGVASKVEKELELEVTEAVEIPLTDDMMEGEEESGLPVLPAAVAVLAVAAVGVFVFVKKKKAAQLHAEQMEEVQDELDGSSADEQQ